MKRALIVTSTAGFAKGFLLHDMQLLQKMGYEVHCAANAKTTVTFNAEELFPKFNIAFHQVDFSSSSPLCKESILASKQINQLLKDNEFELIHCHTPIVGVIVRMVAKKYRKRGCKVIYTTHGLAFPKGCCVKDKILFGSVEKICSRLSDAIITINQEDFHCIEKMHCKKVYYINGVGVDVDRYHNVKIDRKEYRSNLGIAEDDIMVLSVGELSDRKNHQIIIKALEKIQDSKYVFVICGKVMVGNGTYDRLVEMAKEKNVRVLFLGFRADIPEINHCADISVLPSTREGLGLAGIEALASGVPVIGSNVQGIKDYVIDGKTGYLCEPYNAEQFAEKMVLLSDAKTREGMKNYCIEKANEFSIKVSWEQMERIYQEVLNS